MDRFLQLHILTDYGPSNLNRDDTGRPKGAYYGGAPRLRISSQALKRAWRTSDVFAERLKGHLAIRTQRLGDELYEFFMAEGVEENDAMTLARTAVSPLGKLKDDKDDDNKMTSAQTEEMVFLSNAEWNSVFEWAQEALKTYKREGFVDIPAPKRSDLLKTKDAVAADMGMFGRMVASEPKYNREAAVQVSHALTTHKSFSQEDYYTALDDLNERSDEGSQGAGFVGQREFGTGTFYLYICVDRTTLLSNLESDARVYSASLKALVEAAVTVSPAGMQSSFASHSRAFYALAERGNQQPRGLHLSFLKPVEGGQEQELSVASIEALEAYVERFDRVYGACSDHRYGINIISGQGELSKLVDFCAKEE